MDEEVREQIIPTGSAEILVSASFSVGMFRSNETSISSQMSLGARTHTRASRAALPDLHNLPLRLRDRYLAR